MQEENGGGGGSGTRQGAVTTEVMGVQIDMVKRIYLPYNCSSNVSGCIVVFLLALFRTS
jgi:hypothetical protein